MFGGGGQGAERDQPSAQAMPPVVNKTLCANERARNGRFYGPRPCLRSDIHPPRLTISHHARLSRRRHRKTTRDPSRNKTQQPNQSNRFDNLSPGESHGEQPGRRHPHRCDPIDCRIRRNRRCGSASQPLALFAKRHEPMTYRHNTGQRRGNDIARHAHRPTPAPVRPGPTLSRGVKGAMALR